MEKEFIKCYLMGGLGNQIFQHVLLNWLKKYTDKNVIISKSDYLGYKNFIRKFKGIQTQDYCSWLGFEENITNDLMFLTRLKSRLKLNINKPSKILTDNFFLKNLNDKNRFFNDLINFKYLKSYCIFPQIINYQEFLSSWIEIAQKYKKKEITEKIISQKYDIVIHIRRGDYLNFPHIYKELKKDYFINAINEIKKRKNLSRKPNCLIVGNDISWAKRNLINSINVDFQYKDIFSDFSSLVNSENLIISNSSFSTAAAMIGMVQNKEKLIISPLKYYTPKFDFGTITHNSWIKLDN